MKTNEELAQIVEETGKLQIRLFRGEKIEVEGSDGGEYWYPTDSPRVWKFLRSVKTPAELASDRIIANNAKVKAGWEAGGKTKQLQWKFTLGDWKNTQDWSFFDQGYIEYRLAPEPEYVPWSMETHPLDAVWVKEKTKKSIYLVVAWDECGPRFYNFRASYEWLHLDFVRIIETNGARSTAPCGAIKL